MSEKISGMAVASALTGAELMEVVQGGVNKQTTAQDIADLGGGGGGAVDSVNGQTGVVVLDAIDVGADPAGSASTVATNLSNHIADATDAHAGTAITNTPAGNIAATTVQAAINELDTEKVGVSAVVGVQDLPIPAQAMWPRVTSGCSVLTQYEMATSLLNLQGLEFSSSVQQFAQMDVPLPRKYNNGTVTVVIHWKPLASGTGDVRWGIQLASYRNDDPLTGAFGTEVAVTDTFIATDDLHITSASAAITPSGTITDGNLMALQINRDPTNGSDTLTVNAILLAVIVRITTDAAIDA